MACDPGYPGADIEDDVVARAVLFEMQRIDAALSSPPAREASEGCQPESPISSSWKWIAPQSIGSSVQRCVTPPVQREPVIARVGRLMQVPCALAGPISVAMSVGMPMEKSHSAIARRRGAGALRGE